MPQFEDEISTIKESAVTKCDFVMLSDCKCKKKLASCERRCLPLQFSKFLLRKQILKLFPNIREEESS